MPAVGSSGGPAEVNIMMGRRKMQVATLAILCLWSSAGICKAQTAEFKPADSYLVDCGAAKGTTVGGRNFAADGAAPVTVDTSQDILAGTSANGVSSFDNSALYQTARIFTAPSSYTFPIQKQGRHFVRLYFFPFIYQSYDLATAKFTVSTQDVLLLSDFQQPDKTAPLFKEYSLNITHDKLVISFKPSNGIAFINAIEVISVPDDLIADVAQMVNPVQQYSGLSTQSLETVYRVNMGGPKVSPNNDTLSRNWQNDQKYILNPSVTKTVVYGKSINYKNGGATSLTAPDIVYGTATELAASNTSNALFNMTWQFDVDAGFSYLIRFHFCDVVSKALNQLYFNAYVGGFYAQHDLDLSEQSMNQLATAIYVDVVLSSNDASSKLSISIGPSTLNNALPDGILNGLEVMKMGSGSGSAFTVGSSGGHKNLGVIIGGALAVIGLVIIILVLILLCRRKKTDDKQHSKTWMPFSINGLTSLSTGSRTSYGTTLTSGMNGGSYGYRFAFNVLQEATNSFDENWVIGVGGFGKVYKGTLRDDTKVAVKRGNPKSQQGLNEFRTEIELLSRLRHRHLVSLIGYCDERNEMILVYEYMENGTVKSHLYGSENPSLNWKQRLEICIGAARGLHYLHTGSAKAIIHRDVKSANILLDENLLAKVADFGLSKTGPELDQTHVSTAVKGSFGYLDPEYFRRQQLTEKSDVYSFGVVMLEVLCARPVIDPSLPREMVNLAEWGMKWQKRGELHQIIDQKLSGAIRPDSLRKFGETVEKCLADYGVERPSMGDVLWNLEYVLQLQDVDSSTVSDVNSMNRIVDLSSQVQHVGALDSISVTMAEGGASHEPDHDLSDVSMSRVFSQLIKAEGR
ncbi:receptor-like protein kinase HERK 1 [Lolium rigidum]|uniref:receptor-like protein kinase HERK 1 n=1 Tax=Lolium rigidum TaxID=89674 RepID=UPI001F5E1AF4|nr:receptor-like protein kinase HERK 1 [Lolium rigidum]XP_051200325.1 receptor-like protein kinase HERK 1 [Lolium perenne]